MKFALSDLHLHHEEAAFAHVEARLWPDGPVCRHCSGDGNGSVSSRVKPPAPVWTSAMPARSPLPFAWGQSSFPATCRCTSGCRSSTS